MNKLRPRGTIALSPGVPGDVSGREMGRDGCLRHRCKSGGDQWHVRSTQQTSESWLRAGREVREYCRLDA
jgi:hypothetical protein